MIIFIANMFINKIIYYLILRFTVVIKLWRKIKIWIEVKSHNTSESKKSSTKIFASSLIILKAEIINVRQVFLSHWKIDGSKEYSQS